MESGVYGVQPLKAADHQSSGHQEHKRERDLGYHQETSSSVRTRVGVGTPQAFFERLAYIFSGEPQAGKQSGQDPGQQGNRCGESEDIHIQANLNRGGHLIGQECHDQTNSERSECQAERSAHKRQEYRLRQDLSQYAT